MRLRCWVFKRSVWPALLVGVFFVVPHVSAPATVAITTSTWSMAIGVQEGTQSVQLSDVTADRPNDAWAIGSARAANQATFEPVVEHWNGSSWSMVTLPASALKMMGTASPRATIGASSPSNVWAFGIGGSWLHWNGKQWTAGTLAPSAKGALGPYLGSPLVFGPSDAWVFGDYLTSKGTLVPYGAHYNGQAWKSFTVPGDFGFAAESAVSPSDIYAVLNAVDSRSGGALTRWDGSRWSTVRLPSALTSSAELDSVYAQSDSDIWVGGKVSKTGNAVAAHWNGVAWNTQVFRPVPNFSEDALIQMVPDGQDGIWALASCTLGSCWRLWHFSNGQWQGPYQPRISGTATSVTDLAQIPGTTSVWGAGGRTVGSRQQGMILLQGGWPGTVKPAPAHKKAAAARRYRPAARPVAPPNPCPAR
jgi:hypothetical protein